MHSYAHQTTNPIGRVLKIHPAKDAEDEAGVTGQSLEPMLVTLDETMAILRISRSTMHRLLALAQVAVDTDSQLITAVCERRRKNGTDVGIKVGQ